MARGSVPVVHREDGTQGIASHISGVQSKRRACPRASGHDEQARRVRIPRLDENLKARWAGYADAKVEETRAPEMSWFY